MKNSIKRTLISIFIFLLSLWILFFSYISFTKQNIELNEYSKVSSVVKEKGLDLNNNGSECFYLLLKDYNKKLGVYRYSKKYQDLINKIKVDDSIVVYFKKNSNTESINIDLIQIENGSQVLLNKEEYEQKYRMTMYISLFGGIIMLILSYLFYKRKIYPN